VLTLGEAPPWTFLLRLTVPSLRFSVFLAGVMVPSSVHPVTPSASLKTYGRYSHHYSHFRDEETEAQRAAPLSLYTSPHSWHYQ
jgi:hypothetical protein